MIRFHPKAREEALAALDYYEIQKTGLGARFLLEIEETLNRLQSHPNAWPITTINEKRGFRRCLLKSFPYGLIYKTDKNLIAIIAVMHLARKPGYWRLRLKSKSI
jgi:hypothetical protein